MSDPSKYIWEVKYREEGEDWRVVELDEAKEKLSRSYVDVTAILSAMMTGLVAVTPFAHYRARHKSA